MGALEKTAILVISFGTSYEETRKKTIEQIESDLHHAFGEYPLYRAWTSPRIRAKLQKRDGIHIMDIDEAMTQLKADGIRNVVVQPTYVITGFESDAMKEKVLAHKKDFDSVIICDSLMVTKQDKEKVCQAMAQEYHPDPDDLWDMEQSMLPMNFILRWTNCLSISAIPICIWERLKGISPLKAFWMN